MSLEIDDDMPLQRPLSNPPCPRCSRPAAGLAIVNYGLTRGAWAAWHCPVCNLSWQDDE